ncbi:hypothetical protein [Pedobacter hartonius]|uniref:Uncharacterized protein n=1 Tax=Pedobacter hartonius TaxID=425514 RepID=A0A1H3ZHL7_9SPHI|nr:hypothetical protein [Pedobacter hartonius]SEA22901.1 hypothetical protein SAMN05443550_102356 [Pedobacter hartonius]
MKSASVQHLDTLVNHRIYASYQTDFSKLTTIYTYIMKKLTNVSPFIWLLVPVFMMLILTVTSNVSTTDDHTAGIKSETNTTIAKIPYATLK